MVLNNVIQYMFQYLEYRVILSFELKLIVN